MEPQSLDELREYVLRTGPSEVELKLLNVIAIMEQTIEDLSRQTAGLDFYREVDAAIKHNVEAMLAVVEGKVH